VTYTIAVNYSYTYLMALLHCLWYLANKPHCIHILFVGVFSGMVLDKFGLMRTGLVVSIIMSASISVGYFANSVVFIVLSIGVVFGKQILNLTRVFIYKTRLGNVITRGSGELYNGSKTSLVYVCILMTANVSLP